MLAPVNEQLRPGDRIIGGSLIHLSIELDHLVTAGGDTDSSLDRLGEVALWVDS